MGIEGLRQAIKARDSLVHMPPSRSQLSDSGCRDDDDARSQCSSLAAARSEPEKAAAQGVVDLWASDIVAKGTTEAAEGAGAQQAAQCPQSAWAQQGAWAPQGA